MRGFGVLSRKAALERGALAQIEPASHAFGRGYRRKLEIAPKKKAIIMSIAIRMTIGMTNLITRAITMSIVIGITNSITRVISIEKSNFEIGYLKRAF